MYYFDKGKGKFFSKKYIYVNICMRIYMQIHIYTYAFIHTHGLHESNMFFIDGSRNNNTPQYSLWKCIYTF